MSTLKQTEDLLGMPTGGGDWPETSEADLSATPRSDEGVVDESIKSIRERAENIDPDKAEYMDEVVAEALRVQKQKDLQLAEGEKTPGQLFETMGPAQKAALLATHHVEKKHGVSQNHPLWIDRKAVPDTIVVSWLSPFIVNRLGMRGFRRVVPNAQTQRWVPNARQLGSAKFITHANYVLCAIDADVVLERRVEAHRMTNAVLDEQDERFRSALKSVAGAVGLKRETAEQLDRSGRGFVATRGADPELARRVRQHGEGAEPDRVLGSGENES